MSLKLVHDNNIINIMKRFLAVLILGSIFYACEPEPTIQPNIPPTVSLRGGLFK
jgi:hypothetical protein